MSLSENLKRSMNSSKKKKLRSHTKLYFYQKQKKLNSKLESIGEIRKE